MCASRLRVETENILYIIKWSKARREDLNQRLSLSLVILPRHVEQLDLSNYCIILKI